MTPCIVAVSGVSGTGKTTLITTLEQIFPGCRVVTYTTRPMRERESPNDYHFCSHEELTTLPDTLWVKENYGNLYAVTRSSFEAAFDLCGVALLPTITSHHKTLHEYFPSVRHVGIHLLSPKREELANRMRQRGDDKAQIEKRLAHIEHIDKKALMNPQLVCLTPNSPQAILETTLEYIKIAQQ